MSTGTENLLPCTLVSSLKTGFSLYGLSFGGRRTDFDSESHHSPFSLAFDNLAGCVFGLLFETDLRDVGDSDELGLHAPLS